MSVLNWLQRGKAIEVTGVIDTEADVPTWQIDILDDALLADGEDCDRLWDRLEALRLSELQISKGEFAKFHRLMRGPTHACILTGVYDLIDPGSGLLQDCGRCAVCRERRVRPPRHIKSGDLDRIWPQEIQRASPLPSGVTMILPDDPDLQSANASLVGDLADLGFEQFVAPDHLIDEIARCLVVTRCEFGFTLTHSDLLGGRWALAHVPTVFLFDRFSADIDPLWATLKSETEKFPLRRFAVVASPESRAEGRPLQQIASKRAPIAQATLRALILETSEID
jgi:ATP-dependent DNA helicase RecQ